MISPHLEFTSHQPQLVAGQLDFSVSVHDPAPGYPLPKRTFGTCFLAEAKPLLTLETGGPGVLLLLLLCISLLLCYMDCFLSFPCNCILLIDFSSNLSISL